MVNEDTIGLLKECDAGVKIGIESVEMVLDKVNDNQLFSILEKYLDDNKKLENKINFELNKFKDNEKDPNPIAKAMSWIKINFKLVKGEHDKVIADLMTDGCNMGIKSISRYLNQYSSAMEDIKGLCYDLVENQEKFAKDLRKFL